MKQTTAEIDGRSAVTKSEDTRNCGESGKMQTSCAIKQARQKMSQNDVKHKADIRESDDQKLSLCNEDLDYRNELDGEK